MRGRATDAPPVTGPALRVPRVDVDAPIRELVLGAYTRFRVPYPTPEWPGSEFPF